MNFTNRMLKRIFLDTLHQAIKKGTIIVITPEKEVHRIEGVMPGRTAEWRVNDWYVMQALIRRGDIGLGETYVNGTWDTDNLEALFTIFVDNLDYLDRYAHGSGISQVWFRLLNHFIRRNSIAGSKENIQAHYDVGNSFYKLWLDDTMTYSSALYSDKNLSLEQAQKQKYQRILNRISKDRSKILEIGCGWGGFAEQAVMEGHSLTGLTVSSEQLDFAQKRLGKKADIRLQDYREVKGQFEAITSIEMFEAVGMRYWPTYFSTLKNRLVKDGVAVVQTITVKDELFDNYVNRSDYIRHYVFPGGVLPSVAKFKESAEKAGLVCKDIYSFGQDYAKTLKEWLTRFEASEAQIRKMGYDNAFIRSWRLYLCMCAASFTCDRTGVMQVELAHA